MGKDKVAVVDGANIAYIEKSEKGEPKVSNLVAVRNTLEQQGFTPIIIVDASLIYKVDDRKQLDALIDKGQIRQAPAETDADYFVLEVAGESDGYVISNDRFEPYRDQFPWIDRRRIPLMIINGEVELYQPDLNDSNKDKKLHS
jgi:hypothetical protein